jgi:hypothetical protein
LILQSMGIQDCEPWVIEQLLEFIHSNFRHLVESWQEMLTGCR